MARALTDQPVNRDAIRPRGAGQSQRRLDRWVTAGRQLVDGVAGTRPGGRGSRTGFDGVGRWVGERIDWLLEDGDNWREPWQEPPLAGAPSPGSPAQPAGRRPLEALSRRRPSVDERRPDDRTDDGPAKGRSDDGWPDEGAFTIERWQRPPAAGGAPDPTPAPRDRGPRSTGGRPLPRSSRRRQS